MNTNMTGFRRFKNLWVLVLRTKVALAMEGLSINTEIIRRRDLGRVLIIILASNI